MKDLQNTDPAIHNYLLSLYAVEENTEDLMNFLDYFKEDYVYDVKYALRVCIQEGKTQACVYIYTLLHLYEEAVKLALKAGEVLRGQGGRRRHAQEALADHRTLPHRGERARRA